MEYDRLTELVDKMENRTASSGELEELDLFYKSFENNEGINLKLTDEKVYKTELFAKIRTAIGFEYSSNKLSIIKLWPRIAIAVAAVLSIVSFIYFITLPGQTDSSYPQLISKTNDIGPGRKGATLTLSNGKKIRLTDSGDGKLAKEAGITITKASDGQIIYKMESGTYHYPEHSVEPQYNTLSTNKGETYMVILPDKSKVWLNAASILTYSANLLENGKRKVKLEGEAYFEISKDKVHPFVVESNGQKVEVLGTHFNVNAYQNEPFVRTTLLEGSTRIVSASGDEKILKPGQQCVLQGHKIEVNEVDIDEAIAWKNGDFMFNEEVLKSIMRKVERWYNIDVEYQNPQIGNKKFGGTISKFSNVSDVLRMLELTGGVHFKIDGRRIIVDK